MIVIPEWGYLEPGFRDELLAYVQDGGSLLVIGPKAAGLFESELDVTLPRPSSSWRRLSGLPAFQSSNE